MYSFDGEYRRRPVQNFGGASISSDRETIIKKAQQERQKRNELRCQNNSATILQSYARSFIYRQRKKKIEREEFDNFLRKHKDTLINYDEYVSYLLQRILFFYYKKNSKDCDRLIEICQFLIRNPQRIFEKILSFDKNIHAIWLYRVKKILSLCLEQLSVTNLSPAIPMRTLETFSSINSVTKFIIEQDKIQDYLESLFIFLCDHGYFKILRLILEDKCPPLDGITLNAPNPITEAVSEMILRPLILTNFCNNSLNYRKEICWKFSEHFLSPKFTDPIRLYLLQNLANHRDFPYKILIEILSSRFSLWITTNENNIDEKNGDNSDVMMIVDDESTTATTTTTTKMIKKVKNYQNLLTPYLLHSILLLDRNHLNSLTEKRILGGYIGLISEISPKILILPNPSKIYKADHMDGGDDDNSSDSDSESKRNSNIVDLVEQECLLEVIEMLNDNRRISIIISNIDIIIGEYRTLLGLCNICHTLMIYNKSAVYDYRLLYHLAFVPKFIRSLWFTLTAHSISLGFTSPLSLISKGVAPKYEIDIKKTIPFLATFCALFSRLVPTLHDGEFCQENILQEGNNIKGGNNLMPFSLYEVIELSKTLKEVSLGLVELAFPETRSNLNEHYRSVLGRTDSEDEKAKQTKQIWANLLKVVVSVLNQIYTRDLRRNFCPEGHWTVKTLNLPLDRPSDLPLTRSSRRGIRPFQPIRDFTREDFENGPPMSTKQIRSITILREIPFVVAFSTRVGILQGLVAADKIRVQGDLQGFLQGPSIELTVRRSHLYEDAYDKLRPENEPDLRHRFRVQFISSLGMEEAGIDGGGVFREFLSELIKTAFDPNRGFFMVTTDNKLYPNPSVVDLIPEFEKHYYFMGRILGKAIYENLLVELPLAEFFLSKLAGKYSDVDVHQLASLDPELYRNLLSLKAYDGDVSELGLDFTVVSNDLGQTKIKELKPNGQSILVTTSNRIEYIQLMADYKLNKQIRQHCVAFRKGLSNVLPVEWLYMFSNKELQILISGAEIPIDLEDLKNNCKYGGEYAPTHPTILCFWKAIEGFTDLQKRQLLKFVTSCSRPPLLGFKDLDPPFCIQSVGDDERLPTASTCTNLLKLPSFKTVEQMREKLLYAIQAGAGFDLS